MSIFNRVLHSNDSSDLNHSSSGLSTNSNSSTSHNHFRSHSSTGDRHHIFHSSNSSSNSTNDPSSAINLAIELESPPAVLYGAESESTGSIVSGLLFLNLGNKQLGGSVQLEYVTLSLVQTIRLGKPFLIPSTGVQNCEKCSNRKNVLARWDVITGKAIVDTGSHAYPFSHLLPGGLPPSTKLGSKNSVSFIKYDLIAVARTCSSPDEVTVKIPLNITRSILKGPDRNSLRVFPPTEVTASAVLPHVVYPKSTFPVELRLENMNSETGDKRWRMRKLTWRVEEVTKIRAYCCENHQNKLKSTEETQKKAKSTKSTKPSNVHYSTIQTSMLLAPTNANIMEQTGTPDPNNRSNATNPLTPPTSSPSTQPQPADSAFGLSGAPAYVEDNTEVERNRPSHASENFVEDFVNNDGNHSAATSHRSTPSSGAVATPLATPTRIGSSPEQPDLHLFVSESRTVTHGELKSGWKSDFSGRGKIELVAEIKGMNLSTGLVKPSNKASSDDVKTGEIQEGLRHGANLSCDIEDPNEGIFVSHLLVLEVVVAEETVSHKNRRKSKTKATGLEPISSINSATSTEEAVDDGSQAVGTPTGAARVLRMQFKVVVTERSGLGIAWDDEVPPTYEDVRTLSPPTYESSAAPTPQSGTPLAAPGSVALRTPGILYGIGNTPGMSTAPGSASIDGLLDVDDRIQDLTI